MDYEFKTTFWMDFSYVQTIQSDEDIIAERSRMGL